MRKKLNRAQKVFNILDANRGRRFTANNLANRARLSVDNVYRAVYEIGSKKVSKIVDNGRQYYVRHA